MCLPHIYIHNDDVHVQQRFWATVNESKEARDRMQQICGGVLVEEVEIRDRWKEHFEGLYGAADRSGHQTLYRPYWKVSWRYIVER